VPQPCSVASGGFAAHYRQERRADKAAPARHADAGIQYGKSKRMADMKRTNSWPDLDRADERVHSLVRPVGTLLVNSFHYVGLFLIGAATVWAAGWSFYEMMLKKPHATIEDLLLLFIFLEIGAMVGIYFKTNHMPVRFLMYVAITAVTRHLIGVVNHTTTPGPELLIVAGTILILAVSLFAIRYASFHFPAGEQRAPSFSTDLENKGR
jgi:phosphate starvation-inducible membrane PsiE